MDDIIHEWRNFFGDDDLAALRMHRSIDPKHGSKPRIAQPGGEHNALRSDLGACAGEPELAGAMLDGFHALAAEIAAAERLEGDMQRQQQAQRVHVAIMRREARTKHLWPDLRDELFRLGVVEHSVLERVHSRLVVQTLQSQRPVLELALGEEKMQPAGAAKAD